MKSKILNLGLILTSLAGYMEWGGGNRMSLFQAEAEIFSKIFTDFSSVAHPLVLLPLIGQIFLVVTLFQKKTGKVLTFLGMAGVGILLATMLGVGIIISSSKMILSTLPFFITGWITTHHHLTNKETAGKTART